MRISSNLVQRRAMSNLPQYQPAADIKMAYGGLMMVIFTGLMAVGYAANPFQERASWDTTYQSKWKGE